MRRHWSVIGLTLLLAAPMAPAKALVCPPTPNPATLRAALARPPAATPQAMPVLHTEGTLPHQGIYDQSVQAKRDFDYMRVLALAWRTEHDQAALDRLTVYFDAWTGVYRPSFNPIDETSMDGLIDAYSLSQADLPAATRENVRRLLRDMAEGYLARMQAMRPASQGTSVNNWQSHRVKLVTLAAVALHDGHLLNAARTAFLRQLDANMRADGSVIDFEERDALHYVVYDLEPLTRAALAARAMGQDWLVLAGRDGQSLQKGLNWLLPYADGRKTHEEEYVHTAVKFDLQRREAGLPGFSGQWDPKSANGLYWAASLLDARYHPLAQSLAKNPPLWLAAVCTS
ncbi:alginate lyase family protein [Crenobacter sp. SG2305]|uniref:alginate lyase family protein n=1 Tax=Crenobacter oryzisoli TaxID=3056844 RepID=UPI0025AAF78A|nr:alginate lyase family protein [Crenobacter sp. SG2305]MDN0081738.1 alginate lyase family protein [Crenobacter sp. SG2305]